MSELRRIYRPAECDERGVPLNWERCRACGPNVGVLIRGSERVGKPCKWCGDYGSLKAAVLAGTHPAATTLLDAQGRAVPGVVKDDLTTDRRRCEACNHPMSEGTWEGDGRCGPGLTAYEREEATELALAALYAGTEPGRLWEPFNPETQGPPVHYSRCDGACQHRGPGRWRSEESRPWRGESHSITYAPDGTMREASWRQVDVRVGAAAVDTADFDPSNPLHTRPFDLRLENVAVLCLRCWATRTSSREEQGG